MDCYNKSDGNESQKQECRKEAVFTDSLSGICDGNLSVFFQ